MISVGVNMFYFFVVFIGLFLVNNDFQSNYTNFAYVLAQSNDITNRPYNAIEIALLCVLFLDSIIKVAYEIR